MALNEACQLWIEQEIDEGLDRGKTPDLISKEVSQAIAVLFETTVKRATIKKRAQRRKGHLSLVREKREKTLAEQVYAELKKIRRSQDKLMELMDKGEGPFGGGTQEIQLKKAKRGFYRSEKEYPGEPTQDELFWWKSAFIKHSLYWDAMTISDGISEHLPEELPENQSKPRKKKPRVA